MRTTRYSSVDPLSDRERLDNRAKHDAVVRAAEKAGMIGVGPFVERTSDFYAEIEPPSTKYSLDALNAAFAEFGARAVVQSSKAIVVHVTKTRRTRWIKAGQRFEMVLALVFVVNAALWMRGW